MTGSEATRSPVSQEVSAELERVVGRWRQLPLDRALSYAALVRALAQSLADEVAQATGVHASAIPDCGPATLMDQLTVMVYDASVISTTSTVTTSVTASTAPRNLAQDLVTLRRNLR